MYTQTHICLYIYIFLCCALFCNLPLFSRKRKQKPALLLNSSAVAHRCHVFFFLLSRKNMREEEEIRTMSVGKCATYKSPKTHAKICVSHGAHSMEKQSDGKQYLPENPFSSIIDSYCFWFFSLSRSFDADDLIALTLSLRVNGNLCVLRDSVFF